MRSRDRRLSALLANASDWRRWRRIEAALGGVEAEGHAGDEDPAGWVREQRRSDPVRSG